MAASGGVDEFSVRGGLASGCGAGDVMDDDPTMPTGVVAEKVVSGVTERGRSRSPRDRRRSLEDLDEEATMGGVAWLWLVVRRSGKRIVTRRLEVKFKFGRARLLGVRIVNRQIDQYHYPICRQEEKKIKPKYNPCYGWRLAIAFSAWSVADLPW